MASPYAAAITQVTAGTVGSFFVGQYYQMLQAQPSYVHRFYNHLSRMVRIDGPVAEAANSPLEIHSLIMSQSFSSIEIRSAHSIDSWSGGVLVMVSGSVETKEYSARRKFAQTFFLAPQEKGFFVLNDVFQYFDEDQIIEQPPTLLNHENYATQMSSSIAEPATEYVSGGIQGGEFVTDMHSQESVSVDKYSIPDPQQSVPEVVDEIQDEDIKREEPPVSIPSPMVSSRDPPPVEDNLEEPIKHTYASILRSKGQQAPAPQPAPSKSNPLPSEWDQTPEPPVSVESYPPKSSVAERVAAEAADDVSGFDDEGDVTSVYVRNLSSSTTAPEIEQEFKNFGRIKPGGVLIKSRKDADVYYAFVEFEDISGVNNSVQASPILVNGRQLFVEERRPNSVAYRGRRGRGRGGYQQYENNSRGRFGGGRSFGRGNGPDNRDYTNKARGNGNGYYPRGPSRQDRGILGSQNSRNVQNYYEAAV